MNSILKNKIEAFCILYFEFLEENSDKDGELIICPFDFCNLLRAQTYQNKHTPYFSKECFDRNTTSTSYGGYKDGFHTEKNKQFDAEFWLSETKAERKNTVFHHFNFKVTMVETSGDTLFFETKRTRKRLVVFNQRVLLKKRK